MNNGKLNGMGLVAVLLCAVLVSLASGSALAELAFHEPFAGDYAVGDSLAGQGGGEGFAAAWSMPVEGVEGTAVAGLSLGELPVSGLAARFDRRGAINAKRYAFRPIDALRPTREVWCSYLARWIEDNGGKGHSAEVGIGTYSHQDDGDLKLHTRALSINDDNRFAVGYGDGSAKSTEQSNTVDKTVLVVARWAGIGRGNQQATMWVFDSPEAVNAVLNATDDQTLDAHAFARQEVTGVLANLGDDEGLKVGGYIGGDPGAYRIVLDEIRFGTEAGDVLPGAKIAAAEIEERVFEEVKGEPLTPREVGGRTISVATDGDDGLADPTSIDSPVRTIQKAAEIALAGDTSVIREGVYRETVGASVAATAEDPGVFRPYEDENVLINGTEVVEGGWREIRRDAGRPCVRHRRVGLSQ